MDEEYNFISCKFGVFLRNVEAINFLTFLVQQIRVLIITKITDNNRQVDTICLIPFGLFNTMCPNAFK